MNVANRVATISEGKESDQFRMTFESAAKRVADITEFEERLVAAKGDDEKLPVLMEYIDFEIQSSFSIALLMSFTLFSCVIFRS